MVSVSRCRIALRFCVHMCIFVVRTSPENYMWTLIIFIYAGMLSKGDNVSLSSVQGFESQQACMSAGNSSSALTDGTMKSGKFICVKMK